jgi:hypothetical protein
MSEAVCSACGALVGTGDGYRLSEPEAERHATFCRLDHVVSWVDGHAEWRPGALLADPDSEGLGRCAHCADEPGYERVLLVRHRGPLRLADEFCDLEHLTAWARAGGRWRVG